MTSTGRLRPAKAAGAVPLLTLLRGSVQVHVVCLCRDGGRLMLSLTNHLLSPGGGTCLMQALGTAADQQRVRYGEAVMCVVRPADRAQPGNLFDLCR